MATNSGSVLRDRKFYTLLALVINILIIGAVFYSRVEGLSVLDAIYFSVITLTTVGYGDFAPVTAAGKIFTMFYLLVGIGVLLAFISIVSGHTIENYHRIRNERFDRIDSKKRKRRN